MRKILSIIDPEKEKNSRQIIPNRSGKRKKEPEKFIKKRSGTRKNRDQIGQNSETL